MCWDEPESFKKMLLKMGRCFFSLERMESSKSGPPGIKSGDLGSVVQALILAPPLRYITLGELVNLKPPFFLLHCGGNGGTPPINLCRLSVVIEIKCLTYAKHSINVSYY